MNYVVIGKEREWLLDLDNKPRSPFKLNMDFFHPPTGSLKVVNHLSLELRGKLRARVFCSSLAQLVPLLTHIILVFQRARRFGSIQWQIAFSNIYAREKKNRIDYRQAYTVEEVQFILRKKNHQIFFLWRDLTR